MDTEKNKSTPKKIISFVIPVFNEEENIFPVYDALLPIINTYTERYQFEFVFTDNHSTDHTFQKLEQLCQRDHRIRVFRFSRNFGYQKSILTGYLQAKGDALIQLDCDLQDPPELIHDFIKHWEEGSSVVYGIRKTRQEHYVLHTARRLFYRLANYLSEDELPVDAGDFRLIDKSVANALRQMDDAQPYLRGTIAAMGFKQTGILYNRRARERGVTHFRFKELVRLAIDGILNHSIVPLRIATFFGALVCVLTLLGILLFTIGRLVLNLDWPAGFTTLAVLILTGISLNALFLGIIGEYLGRIYQQVKKKPLVIIEKKLESSGS